MPEQKEKVVNEYTKVKIIKTICKSIAGIFVSFNILFIILLLIIIVTVSTSRQGFSTSTDYTKFSPQVEQYRIMVTNECRSQGIEYYVDVVLAIMQVETGGETNDPMNSSDKESNTQYGHNRGDIQNVSYSIQCGVTEIKYLIDATGVKDLYDTTHLAIMYEAYELDRDYVQYALNSGGYSPSNANEYMSQDGKESISTRNANFAVNVAMYISLITNGLKKFIYPLAIFTVLQDYTEDVPSIYYGGVYRQVILSCCDGEVTSIDEHEDYSDIEVTFENFKLQYSYVTNVNVTVGSQVKQGTTLGMLYYLEDYDSYTLKFSMMKDGNYVNPNEYLDVLDIQKADLDPESIQEGESIAEYANGCIDNLPYVPGGSSASGADEIGFIHNVFSNFTSYDEDYFDLPTSSFDDLINCSYVAYSNNIQAQIKPQIMYEGDVIIYADANGNYTTAAIYVGDSRVVHMTSDGVVKDFFNFQTPAILIRLLGKQSTGMTWPLPGYGRWTTDADGAFNPARVNPVTGKLEPHKGTDMSAPTGTEVVAADNGTVVEANFNSSCGYHVILDHGNGMRTYYYHSSELKVSKDDTVTKGQVIMLVGSTGQATGPHLHFGMTIDGEWVDAMQYTYENEP